MRVARLVAARSALPLLALGALVALSATCADASTDWWWRAIKRERVVPDVIDWSPRTGVGVYFKRSGAAARYGNELWKSAVDKAPKLDWWDKPKTLYTVMMVDADAPSRTRPSMRSWLHWLVVNVPRQHVAEGQVVASYEGAEPPEGTGFHRYVILVFKQRRRINEPIDYDDDDNRSNFSVRDFARRHALGSPEAGNFFQSRYEELE